MRGAGGKGLSFRVQESAEHIDRASEYLQGRDEIDTKKGMGS